MTYKRCITFWQVSSGREVYFKIFQIQYRLDFAKNYIAGMKTEKKNVKRKSRSSVEFCSDRWIIEDPTYMYRAWTHYLQCLLHNKCQGITNMNNISCI